MDKKVFTIKSNVSDYCFGFERSQLARQNIFNELGVYHEFVMTNITDVLSNFVEVLEDQGFKNFYHVIFDKSDIARDKPSITDVFCQNRDDIEEIEYTKEGFVGLVYYKNGMVECYTSSLLYTYYPNGDFILYDSKGALLVGEVNSSYHKYKNKRTGEVFTQWQAVNEYLSENSSVDDVFITDMMNDYPGQLERFFRSTGRKLHIFIHYNILDPMMKYTHKSWCENIVASPVIERVTHGKFKFLPPIYVDNFIVKDYTLVKNWCIVGNMSFIKRCEIAILAFKELPDINLTIYGNLPVGWEEKDLPKNVKYGGFVENVPYEKHEGYLSCSISEGFSNSAVEASSQGLVCLLSDVDLAHREYSRNCERVELFTTSQDLICKLNNFSKKGKHYSATFSRDFTRNIVCNYYKNMLL